MDEKLILTVLTCALELAKVLNEENKNGRVD